ncbi:MAG: aminotransferase class V-fold PLP-dependent enzyme, partial [Balneolaceae bacterium]
MNCQKHLFELPEDVHYLNCAYMSPNLRNVEKAGITGVIKKREPWTITPDHFFNDSNRLRKLFAHVVNASKPEDVAILPSVSYGMATVAKNLPVSAGRKIIIAGEQFPSNVYSWRRFCDENKCELTVVEAPENGENRGEKWNYRILEAITTNTLMV